MVRPAASAAALLALAALLPPSILQEPDGGAPGVPEGLFTDPRHTAPPQLDETATAVVNANGTVTSYKSGAAVNIPVPSNRSPLGIALEQCANNDGDWVGFYGRWPYALGIGDTNGPRDTARAQGYQGVSLIGLDENPASTTRSQLEGIHFAQRVGINRDLALACCVVDSWSIMPVATADLSHPPFGNISLERIRFLGVSNDQPGLKVRNGKNYYTTRLIRGHGAARWHIFFCEAVDGVEIGDGLFGASEHFFYYDAQQGDSEVVGNKCRGAQWTFVQAVGRYTDRLKAGGVWQERYPFGKLLIADNWTRNIGSAGAAMITIAGGGLLDVTVSNHDYEAGFEPLTTTGQIGANGWLGCAIVCYTDHKAHELDDVNYPAGQGPVIARGYSMEPHVNPPSDGLAGKLPDDGYGCCNSITIIGGKWRKKDGNAPLWNFRNCRSITIIEQAEGVAPLELSGGMLLFAKDGGTLAQNRKMGDGLVPSKLTGYWQQALLVSRRKPSTWLKVPIRMGANPVTLTAAEVDSWWSSAP